MKFPPVTSGSSQLDRDLSVLFGSETFTLFLLRTLDTRKIHSVFYFGTHTKNSVQTWQTATAIKLEVKVTPV